MSTADIAVIALGAENLATTGAVVWLGLKVAPRLRIVNPPAKAAQQPAAEPAPQTTPLTEVATEQAA